MGLVLNGRLYEGSRGLVEGGHMIIDNQTHGRECSCGQIGCVEAYSSAKNVSMRMYEADKAEEAKRLKKSKHDLLDNSTSAQGEMYVQFICPPICIEVDFFFTRNPKFAF